MQWVSANRKVGSTLALFALALQIVLSFGHVHLGTQNHSRLAAAVSAASVPATDDSGQPPAQRRSHGVDDYCAICASIQLLGASLVAVAPLLPLPFARADTQFSVGAGVLVAPRRAPFQSRAPPVA